MEPIINSILDQDLYTFTQQQAILEKFPNTDVEYRFINRRKDIKFDQKFLAEFDKQIYYMAGVKLTDKEFKWIETKCKFLKPWYLEYLWTYRFDPGQVKATTDADGNLDIVIKGSWDSSLMWEVVILALVCEIYYTQNGLLPDMSDFEKQTIEKREKLTDNKVVFNDFGTRRRRAYSTQDKAVEILSQSPYCFGSSNVHMAMKYGINPVGTQSHQWTMGVSALVSLRHANRFAMEKWTEVYNGDIGVALPDTFTTDVFLKDFDQYFAKLFDAVRQDSGSPFEFADKIIDHYKRLKIDPMSKTIIFSDGLDVDKAIEINEYCQNKIKAGFGIGTDFSGKIGPGKPLNIVCKLVKVNGIPVVKISDSPGKEIGDADALRVAKWTFFGTPL